MITGILWRQSEFFYKIEHVVLFTAWNQQAQTLFKLRNIPSSVESFSLSFLKKFWKVCYIFHQCDIQLFVKQMIFYWTRYWSIFFFLLFHFWDDFIFMQKFLKHFWVVFTSLSSSTKKQDGQSSQFFCRTFEQFHTSKTQKIIFFCPHTF